MATHGGTLVAAGCPLPLHRCACAAAEGLETRLKRCNNTVSILSRWGLLVRLPGPVTGGLA